MRKRVALARRLITSPAILLMDEPFSALDVQTRALMADELLELWAATSASVVFVTHDLEEAIALVDRVVVITVRPGGRSRAVYDIDLPRPRRVCRDPLRAALRRVAPARSGRTLRDEVARLLRTYCRPMRAADVTTPPGRRSRPAIAAGRKSASAAVARLVSRLRVLFALGDRHRAAGRSSRGHEDHRSVLLREAQRDRRPAAALDVADERDRDRLRSGSRCGSRSRRRCSASSSASSSA